MDRVSEKNMSALMSHNTASSEMVKPEYSDRWSRVFAEHGEVWGQDPSPSCLMLIQQVEGMRDNLIRAGTHRPQITILDAGCGYGRDLKNLLEIKKAKIDVHGVDESTIGSLLAREKLQGISRSSDIWIFQGDFSKKVTPIQRENYDFLLSHRVMHLLGNNGKLKAFFENAHDVLKPGGTAVISARDERDFKPDAMTRRADGTVVYNDRPDHVITLWKTKDLVSVFERNGFEVQEAVQSSEIESTLHPDEMSYFTIVRATKKLQP